MAISNFFTEPLIPFSLYGYLIHTAHEMSDDAKKRLTIIKAVITSSMPDTNKRVIKSLLFLLYAMQVRFLIILKQFMLTFDTHTEKVKN
jgi:hypothetical protein